MQTREGAVLSISSANSDRSGFPGKVVLFMVMVAFILVFIAYSFANLNYNNIQRLNFPASSKSEVCNLQHAYTYPFLYIDLASNPPLYRCVNQCPSGWNQFIITDSAGSEIYCSAGEEADNRMGGICWSAEKEAAMKERGLWEELSYKQNILQQFKSILIILLAAFLISLLILALFFWLPQSVNYFASVAISALLLGGLNVLFCLRESAYQSLLIIITLVITGVLVLNVVCGVEKLRESAVYTDATLGRIKRGAATTVLLKASLLLLVYNIINFAVLILLLLQFVSLVSSQQQHKSDERIFFAVVKSWWKYLLLLVEWLMLSTVLKEMYTFSLVRFGYQLNKGVDLNCMCFSFNDLVNIFVFSFILMHLWLPLKLVELFKPDGAIIRQNEEETCCHRVTKAAYCCCGYAINKVHRYTFNPYLILALGQHLNDIDGSLRVVQESYHIHDERYDKSSLWIYRLCNYITVIILSIFCMNLLSRGHLNLSSPHTLFFYLLSAVLAVEISRINMTFWSVLVEVEEFIAITLK